MQVFVTGATGFVKPASRSSMRAGVFHTRTLRTGSARGVASVNERRLACDRSSTRLPWIGSATLGIIRRPPDSAPLPKFGGTIDIMRVTIQLPDDISAVLEEQWDDVPRRSLEAIAVEAYRTGALTESQVRRLLGLESRFQVHAVLKEHHVPLQYSAADLEDDLRAQRELGILPSR